MIRQKMIELRGKRSQLEIAKLLGISQQQYSNIEQGKRGIKPKYFKKFEIVFNEDIHELAPDIFMPNNTP
jgi:transcriptional regulator with XRE-family HTH domain